MKRAHPHQHLLFCSGMPDNIRVGVVDTNRGVRVHAGRLSGLFTYNGMMLSSWCPTVPYTVAMAAQSSGTPATSCSIAPYTVKAGQPYWVFTPPNPTASGILSADMCAA